MRKKFGVLVVTVVSVLALAAPAHAGGSIEDKATAVFAAIEDGNTKKACAALRTYIVAALREGDSLDASLLMVNEAIALADQIGCF